MLGKARSGDACRASAILARAQRREVRPNIWVSRRFESGLPACRLSRYAATAPTGPWDQPCAMFAVRVTAMPSASSQRAREGTATRCRAAYRTTIELA